MIFRRSDAVFLTTMALLVAGLMFISHKANADTYLYTGAWSHHIGASRDYNETHNLLALEHNAYMAGYFKNSQGDGSALVGVKWAKPLIYDLKASVMVGASYGYKADCLRPEESGATKVCPMAVPAITYTGAKVQPSLSMIGNAVTFSIRWKL